MQQTVGVCPALSAVLEPQAEGRGDGLGKWGRPGPPLPTAVNKWQLADQAGHAAVTLAGQPMSSQAAVAPPGSLPAFGWSGGGRGLRPPVRAPGPCFWEALGRSAGPFMGSPTGAASFLTFPTFWGRRAGCGGGVGKMAGKTAQPEMERNSENFSLARCPAWARASGPGGGIFRRLAHSGPGKRRWRERGRERQRL